MGLKTLSIDDSAHAIDALDVEHIETIDDTSMELPDQFSEDNTNELSNAVAALEEISVDLRQFGMTRDKAMVIEGHIPGFYRKAGGGRSFTPYASIEGLAPALEAVDGEKKNILQRFWQWLVERAKAVFDFFRGQKEVVEEKREGINKFNEALQKVKIGRLLQTFDFDRLDDEAATTKFIAQLKLSEASDESVRDQIQQAISRVITANKQFKSQAQSNAAAVKIVTGSVGFGLYEVADAVAATKSIVGSLRKAINSSNGDNLDLAEAYEVIESFKKDKQVILTKIDVENSDVSNLPSSVFECYNRAQKYSTEIVARGSSIEAELDEVVKDLSDFINTDLKTAMAKTLETDAGEYNKLMKLVREALVMISDIRRNYQSLVSACRMIVGGTAAISSAATSLLQLCAKVGTSEESRKSVKMMAATVGVTIAQPAATAAPAA